MTDHLLFRHFSALADRRFKLKTTEGEQELELQEITRLGSGDRDGGAFSLVFAGPSGNHFEQQTVCLDHTELGEIDIFLVPLGPKGDANLYEAVFT